MKKPARNRSKIEISTNAVAAIPSGVSELELRQLTHKISERVKELNCLYSISQLVEDRNSSIDKILQGIVDVIPPAWQHPEVTCACIKLKNQQFKTINFRETRWQQAEIIMVNGRQYGSLEVYYLEEKPEFDEGPFLQEERNLIRVIAERTGHIIEHKLAEVDLQTLYKKEKKLRQLLQKEMQSRIDFTRNLIHELKTPLTSLVATSQLLFDEESDKKLSKLTRYIWEGANNLNNRIDELHDVVRGEIGKLNIDLKPLDLGQLLQTLVGETKALSQQYNVVIRLMTSKHLPKVYADSVRMRQVILNLLNNAFRYAAEGGKVTIKATPKSKYVTVEVKDYGPGIAQKDQAHIFEPGYQKVCTDKHTGGLGIGLAFCKMLIELHGGKIWVKSRPGSGSSFVFTLPLLEEFEKEIKAKKK